MKRQPIPVRGILSAFVVVVLASSAGAQQTASPAPRDLAPVLKPILATHADVPALWGAIVEGDRLTDVGAVGVRKAGSAVPVTAADLIHLGSCTKAMTATLIGQLIDARQLSLTTPMSEVFPELRPRMNPDAAKITVAQLLSHTAGLAANLKWGEIDATRKPIRLQRNAAVEQLLTAAPLHAPGTRYEYSNAGYVLLGAILEHKTDQSWESLIESRLFKPLKMTSAGFGPPGVRGGVDQPWGHVRRLGAMVPIQADNPPVMGPAGRVHCTIADWGKFVATLVPPHPPRPELVKPQTLAALLTPGPAGEYAGGWIVTSRPWAGGTTLTHAGSNTMWFCVAWVAPKRNFAVLVATNVAGDGVPAVCDEAAAALIGLHQKH